MMRDQDGVLVWQYAHKDAEEVDGRSVSMIVLATAQLFAEHADRVRACAWCKDIFLAVKRQEYCTPQHAQLARDQKKGPRATVAPRRRAPEMSFTKTTKGYTIRWYDVDDRERQQT